MPHPADYLPILASNHWFTALPSDLAQALIAMAQVRFLPSREALFLRGDTPCGLYAVVRGAIDISGVGGSGGQERPALLARLEAPAWFGEIALFDGALRTHDARAAHACTLLHMPQEPLLAWLRNHPDHWHVLALLLTDKLRTAFVAIEELALLPAQQRLVRRLVMMAEGYGEWEEGCLKRRCIVLSQEELSQLLAISRQTVNQILKDLQARSLVRIHRGQIEICDLAGLRAACQ